MILSRDVPGQRSLSRDNYCCPCPGTKGQRDKENVLVPGQRDSGTSRPGLSRDVPRDVPSRGNALFNLFQSLKVKNEFGVELIDQQMDPEQSGFNSAYHQRLTSIINEAIRNSYI